MLLTTVVRPSLVLGVLLVLDRALGCGLRLRSADEIQAALGARALALVPDLSRRETQGSAAEDYILQKPHSAYAGGAADPHQPVPRR